MLPRRSMALVLAAPLLAVTACGDAERLQPNINVAKSVSVSPVQPTIGPPPPTTTPPAAPTTAAAGTAATSTAPAQGGDAGANAVNAQIDNKFAPAELQVKVGTTVTWTNKGGFHTVTGGQGPAPDPASPIGNHNLDTEGKTVKVTFDKAGTYPYVCVPHLALGMKGQVVVS